MSIVRYFGFHAELNGKHGWGLERRIICLSFNLQSIILFSLDKNSMKLSERIILDANKPTETVFHIMS